MDALAASPVKVVATGTALGLTAYIIYRHRAARAKEVARQKRLPDDAQNSQFAVTTMEQLRDLIPAGGAGSCPADSPKVLQMLDNQMVGFIERSPFLHLATCDKSGLPFCSPKGDAPGFVRIVDERTLLIPDRPGNQLLFGLQNILDNPRVGLCFVIPGNNTTLRVGGRALLTKDPATLSELSARRKDAVLAIHVQVEYAFFHCAKAFLRSKLWQQESWPQERYQVTFGKYFSSVPTEASMLDAKVENHYAEIQEAVDGKRAEPVFE